MEDNFEKKHSNLGFFAFLSVVLFILAFLLLFFWPEVLKGLDKLGGINYRNNSIASAVRVVQENSEPESAPEPVVEVVPEPTPVPDPVPVPEPTPEPNPVFISAPESTPEPVLETVIEPFVEPDFSPPESSLGGGSGSGEIISGGGGGGGAAVVDATAPDKPVVISPDDFSSPFATSTITFEGTAEADSTVSTDFSSDTAVATNGTWSLTLSGISEGSNTIIFYATDEAGNVAINGTIIELEIDTTAPTFDTFSILQCDNSLSTTTCLSGSETIDISWTSSSTGIASYKVWKDGVLQETLTGTSTTLSVSNGASVSIEVSVADTSNNTSTSTAQSVDVSTMPVVINEIAWAGTQSSTADEWIELYNRSSGTIDLSSVKIVASDGVPLINLTGTIAASSYYLIERTDDDATSVTADLTAAFSGDGAGSELSNTQETLSLIHALGGQASTTLDSTPTTSSCSGSWCAGSNVANPFSMERIDTGTLGSISTNWRSNNGFNRNGTDSGGNDINGTPKAANSNAVKVAGYYCMPETSTYLSGGYYSPTDGTPENDGYCTYLATASMSGKGHRVVFKGIIASSTELASHFTNHIDVEKTEQGDNYTGNGAVQGSDFFVAIFKIRIGPAFDDYTLFTNFFKDGSSAPPTFDYEILEWKYGVAP